MTDGTTRLTDEEVKRFEKILGRETVPLGWAIEIIDALEELLEE